MEASRSLAHVRRSHHHYWQSGGRQHAGAARFTAREHYYKPPPLQRGFWSGTSEHGTTTTTDGRHLDRHACPHCMLRPIDRSTGRRRRRRPGRSIRLIDYIDRSCIISYRSASSASGDIYLALCCCAKMAHRSLNQLNTNENDIQ
jgi:hypothetical protein